MNSTNDNLSEHPLGRLERDDLNLITELVLQSGSLKALAESYSVSYPTIRARLDKTIARLRDAVDGRAPDPLSDLLAGLVERGELSPAGARAIREAARKSATPHSTPHAPNGETP